MSRIGRPDAAIPAVAGIGLRFPHHRAVIETRPAVGWMEVHPENYMDGGAPLAQLATVRRDYPLALHGVGLSLGSAEGIDPRHLARLAALAERIEPALVSEHVTWSVSGGVYLADLLPLPLTEESLDVVCRNVDRMQTGLRRRVLVENPSSYLRYRHSTIPEWEFMAAVARRSGCGILCDVNNIAVSAANHGFDPLHYLRALPRDRIGEIHLAGHSIRDLGDGRTHPYRRPCLARQSGGVGAVRSRRGAVRPGPDAGRVGQRHPRIAGAAGRSRAGAAPAGCGA